MTSEWGIPVWYSSPISQHQFSRLPESVNNGTKLIFIYTVSRNILSPRVISEIRRNKARIFDLLSVPETSQSFMVLFKFMPYHYLGLLPPCVLDSSNQSTTVLQRTDPAVRSHSSGSVYIPPKLCRACV